VVWDRFAIRCFFSASAKVMLGACVITELETTQ
jgi:hypothetical protein